MIFSSSIHCSFLACVNATFCFTQVALKVTLSHLMVVTYAANITTASATQTGKVTKQRRLQVMFNLSSKGKYVPRVFLKTFLTLYNTNK